MLVSRSPGHLRPLAASVARLRATEALLDGFEAFIPLVFGITAGCGTAALWLAAKPTPAAAAITGLCVVAAVLGGDLVAGALVDSKPTTGLWQATSRVTLTGVTLGIAVAGAVHAHLSLLLTTLACGAASVVAIRAASSEYEAFTLRLLATSQGVVPTDTSEAIAMRFVRVRLWSMMVAIAAGLIIIYPPSRWPGIELISLAVLWAVFISIPRSLAEVVAKYELSLRGMLYIDDDSSENAVSHLQERSQQLVLDLRGCTLEGVIGVDAQYGHSAPVDATASGGCAARPTGHLAAKGAKPQVAKSLTMVMFVGVIVVFCAFIVFTFVAFYVAPSWIPSIEQSVFDSVINWMMTTPVVLPLAGVLLALTGCWRLVRPHCVFVAKRKAAGVDCPW
jgi:hypothetical protein